MIETMNEYPIFATKELQNNSIFLFSQTKNVIGTDDHMPLEKDKYDGYFVGKISPFSEEPWNLSINLTPTNNTVHLGDKTHTRRLEMDIFCENENDPVVARFVSRDKSGNEHPSESQLLNKHTELKPEWVHLSIPLYTFIPLSVNAKFDFKRTISLEFVGKKTIKISKVKIIQR